jgi:hypothetical protein
VERRCEQEKWGYLG